MGIGDEAVRLTIDDLHRLDYARTCVMTVHAHRLDYDPTLANRTIDTLDRLIASGADTGAIVARKAESRLNAEDVARLRFAYDVCDPADVPPVVADAIRTVLAKLEGR